ncbi:hypothetical protein KXQ82_16615 [Mucilaginibacter sp. HMF5004]|uniref:hypothetical protein n=1 Tax=Mucilaginibacter rivuli TaxID=2857527 RepID=UPI001C5DFC73|nr:hypothetical protein [Mucilaginibacter rivuli]MBW4891353.1 hypothetical protein [Mucilaginibacter rivuli]
MKTKNSIPVWPYFLIVTFFACISIMDAYDTSKATMSIAVVTHASQLSTRNSYALPANNAFVTGGGSGTLIWHPESIWQTFVLKMTDTRNLNFMDVQHWLFLFVFVFVFYVMTRNRENKAAFIKNAVQGFRVIFFIIAITPALEFLKFKLLNRYVEHITGGQFTLPAETIQWYYFYLGIMLIVLSRFIEKAIVLWDDQNAAA